MKIAILPPSSVDSLAPFRDLDPPRSPDHYLPGHDYVNFQIRKASAVRQVVEIARMGFDAAINLCDGPGTKTGPVSRGCGHWSVSGWRSPERTSISNGRSSHACRREWSAMRRWRTVARGVRADVHGTRRIGIWPLRFAHGCGRRYLPARDQPQLRGVLPRRAAWERRPHSC